MNPKDVVARGYDRIAERYVEWSREVRVEERKRYTDILLTSLPMGASVLELGCGAGIPTTSRLAEKFDLIGVDISPKQIELAAQNVQRGRFVCTDMSTLVFPFDTFDAVVAFYSLTHLPRGEQPQLLTNIAAWLRPGGLFVASLGAADSLGSVEQNWLGAPMYFSHYTDAINKRLVRNSGLQILQSIVETAEEDG